MKYIPVIGLEVHVELSTKSKMFCQCEADYFGKKPNSNVCPVCLGMPGALPVPNVQAVEDAQLIGRSLNCKLNKQSKFDRKHYFYPDLPKGYQISQYDEPLASNGYAIIKGKKFRIQRVHLEEDTGKLTHQGDATIIDFNRSGVPLVEIVTEPDFTNSNDVKNFLEELQNLIRYLYVSNADMEKGSMRLEPNISLKEENKKEIPNYKVEVKNINSFKFVQKAIEYELKRQEDLLARGETPEQETRGFNENKGITFSQRTKEEAHDYRYFPEPDIPPMVFEKNYLAKLEKKLPELPNQKVRRYVTEFKVRERDAFILTKNKKACEYFEAGFKKVKDFKPQEIANLIVNKKIATNISFEEFLNELRNVKKILKVDKKKMNEVILKVLKENTKAVGDYKAGKKSALMFLLGQVMRYLGGSADAKIIKEELLKKLEIRH